MRIGSQQRVVLGARAFGMATVLGLGMTDSHPRVLLGMMAAVLSMLTATYLSQASHLDELLVIVVEATVMGLIIGLTFPNHLAFLPYPVVLALLAGLARGVVGVSAVILVQCVVVGLIAGLAAEPDLSDSLRELSPWLLTSIGGGLFGSWLRTSGRRALADGEDSYLTALRLMLQLRTVARRLPSGLDPVSIAEQIRAETASRLRALDSRVQVDSGGSLVALSRPDAASNGSPLLDHVTFDEGGSAGGASVRPVDGTDGYRIVFPLTVGSRTIGRVLALTDSRPTSSEIREVKSLLDEHSLRLETALVFDEIRSIATLEERRRLAREIHDGIAQDVASLGYAVDGLIDLPSNDPPLTRELVALRENVSRVVQELRLSIHDLRTELPGSGLGTALADYVRQVGAQTTMTVHLSLDEASARLRPEVEMELLRIAQEAITNARKHSDADNLWVTCEINPPSAYLCVRDDGSGLLGSRPDSYGLRVMEERAARLGGELRIDRGCGETRQRGTTVTVTIPHVAAMTSER